MTKQYLIEKISKRFCGAKVSNVKIDEEFGNVTATINGVKNVDAGFIEEYRSD